MKALIKQSYQTILFLIFLSVFIQNSFSQVKVEFENPGQFYNMVVKTGLQKLLSADKLLAIKPQPLAGSFADTLKKYYWIELSSYHYTEKLYSTRFDEHLNDNSAQIDFREFDNDGVLVEYQLNKTLKDTIVTTVTFDKLTASKIVAVKNINKANYLILEFYGEKENLHLVNYSNGILIQDISMNGRVGEKANFRIAYMAIIKP